MDYLTLSHADLLTLARQQQVLSAEQQARIAELQLTVQRLEQRLRDLEGGSGPTCGLPGHTREPIRPLERRRAPSPQRARRAAA